MTLRVPTLVLLVCLAPAAAAAEENSADLFGPPQPAPVPAAPAPAGPAEGEDSSDLFGPAPAATQAPASTTTPSPSLLPPGLVLKPHGWHEFGFHQPVYGDRADYHGEMKAPAFRNNFGLEARFDSVKLVSDWQLDLLLDRVASTSDNVQPRVRPLENYLRWSPASGSLRLTAGLQTFAWGAADQVNPTDNLNPRDYTLGVMNAPKVPVLALAATWYPVDALSLEAVYVPVDQQDRFPADFAQMTAGQLGPGAAVGYRDLDLGPRSFVAGGRVLYRGQVDASLSYLYDFDQYYVASVEGGLFPVPAGTVALERPRLHRVGADLKTTVGSFGVWAEASANFTEHSDAQTTQRHWWIDYVAGLDTSFGPADKAYLNLQYLGSVVPDFDSDPFDRSQLQDPAYGEAYFRRALAGSLGFQTARLWQGASLALKVELLDGMLEPELRVIYLVPLGYDDSSVTHYGSLALNPEVDFMPVDSFHIKLGAELAWSWVGHEGQDGVALDHLDRIGEFTRSNNVYLKLSYQWDLEVKK